MMTRLRLSACLVPVLLMFGPGQAPALCTSGSTDYTSPGTNDDFAFGVAVGNSGDLVVAGSETGSVGGGNWRVRRYDPTLGILLSSTDYNGPANGADSAYGVCVDASGNVIVVGSELGGASGNDWRVRKYDATLTTLLATTNYNGPGGGHDTALAVAVDGLGNVVVAGWEGGNGGFENWRVRKYNPTLTALLGSTDYNGPGNDYDRATGVAVDGSGNIVVAGYEWGSVGTYNWRVRRYNSTLTSLLSTTAYNGGGNTFDYAYGVVLDTSANVVVVGSEVGTVGGANWRMRKYNPTLTAVLSSTDYASPGSSDDIAYGVALDGSGNVVVAGSEGAGGFDNWRMRKYDPALTTLISSTLYAGPGGMYDAARGVTVDGNGTTVVAGLEWGSTGGYNWRVRTYSDVGQALVTMIVPSGQPVSVGQTIPVRLTVSNPGCDALADLSPDLSILPGGGGGVLVAGPIPASTTYLGTGQSFTFTWTWSATAAGVVTFSGTATGYDPVFSATLTGAASATLLIQTPAALVGSVAAGPPSVYPGDAIRVTLTVTNTGQATATNVRPPLAPLLAGSATAFKATGPSPAVSFTLTGGSATTFTWVFTAGPSPGTVSFTASGSGFDKNSGATVFTVSATSGIVTIITPLEPCPAAGTRIVDYDNFYGSLDDIGNGIALSPGGTIFVAGSQDMDYFMRRNDIMVAVFPPAGGNPYTVHEAFSAGGVEDIGYAVARLSNGSHVAVGTLGNGAWIGADDEAGANLWALTPATAAGGPDELRAVAADPVSGGFYVAGRQRRADLGQGDNLWLAKYTAGGALVWSINYNAPANSDEAAYAVAVEPSGSVFVAGVECRPDVGQGRNGVLLKVAANGTVLWAAQYDTQPGIDDEARALALDAQGRPVTGGFITRTDLGQGDNGWVRAWNPDASWRWQTTFNSPLVRVGGPADRVLGLAVDPASGDVYATGQEERVGRKADLILRRWSASGTLLEAQAVNGPNSGDDEGHAIAIGPGGDLYVAGQEDWQHLLEHANLVVHRWSRPGCLRADLVVEPVLVSTGQWVTVSFTVSNVGGSDITTLTPVIAMAPATGVAEMEAGPLPPVVLTLAPGTCTTFVWTVSASGAGTVTFTATASGIHSGTGSDVSVAASATLFVQTAARLTAVATAPATACAGQVVAFAVTVTNTGQASLLDLGAPDPPLVTGTATLDPAGAPSGTVLLGGGGSVTLLWTYTVVGAGTAAFSVTVTGTDANSGIVFMAGPLTAGPLATGAPAGLVSAVVAPVLAPVGGWFTVELTVTNTGPGPALGVSPAIAPAPAGAPLVLIAAPAPLALPPGGATTFVWTWSVAGWGSVAFSLTAAGSDFCGPASVSATTATVLLGTPTAIVASLVSAGPAAACLGTPITVVVSVTNTGQVPATPLAGPPLFVEGAAIPIGPAPSVSLLGGGAAVHLTWTYSATASGTVRFTATVTAVDARTGATLFAGPITTPLLTSTAPAVLLARASVPPTVVAGEWMEVVLSVTNAGMQDAVNVSATRFSASPAANAFLVSGPVPAGPLTLPPGGSQMFTWTFSIGGSGALSFSITVGGETCGLPPVTIRASGKVATFVLRPAQLVATAFQLQPTGLSIGDTFNATLTLKNLGDAAAWVAVYSRTAGGVGGLGPPTAPLPAPGFLLTGGGQTTVTWTQDALAPCGLAYAIAQVSGTEYGTGRAVETATVFSNPVSVAGIPIALTVGASATNALADTVVTLTAVLTDTCGLGVPTRAVTFTVLAGGGTLAAPTATTNTAGVATVSYTMGPGVGVNTVSVSLASAGLSATVDIGGESVLSLTEPGVALDRNVVDLSRGDVVIARVYPKTNEPVTIRIFTGSGRLVRTLRALFPLGPGQFVARWDGLTEDGFRVARGVYLVRVDGGGLGATLKLVVK